MSDRTFRIARRKLLVGAALVAALPWAGAARAQALDSADLGLKPNSTDDQSGAMQEALLRATREGRPLALRGGNYICGNLQVPGDLDLRGVPGATVLVAAGVDPVARIAGSAEVTMVGIAFSAGTAGPDGDRRGLLEIEASEHVTLSGCSFTGGKSNGIAITDAAVDVERCQFSGHGRAALFAIDSRGLQVTGNRIERCGNGGILLRGSASRHDGSVINANMISRIGWTNGGNGQNGNGINISRCDDVIVSDNQLGDCAFSSIRLNATQNAIVQGNVCRNSGEVAILSEFSFAGSVVSSNVVDGAATGISIANLDRGGRLAVCSGNIVRNIRPRSEVNPDTKPVGIYAEAETVVSGNTVDGVPGVGILAGSGAFLRNVAVADNVVTGAPVGIGVSVVQDPPIGAVRIDGNMISGASTAALAGYEGDKLVSDDLARDAGKYPQLRLGANTVS